MINIKVACAPKFNFVNGVVFGEIIIRPESLLDAIFYNISIDYQHPCRKSIRSLISKEAVHQIEERGAETISLLSGEVTNNFISMTLHQAMDRILEYIHADSVDVTKLHYHEKLQWHDLMNFKEYIYACDNCSTAAETANVDYEL